MYLKLKQNSKSSKPNNLILAASLACLLGLMACSSAPVGDRSKLCADKFGKAEKLFGKEKYWASLEPLEEIMNECHGTGYMERSQYMLGESHFHLEDWIEARSEYSTFLLNFPSSPYAETAAYRKAISSYRMSYTDMRDDSPTQTAMRDFQDFSSNYPSSGLLDSSALYQDSLMNRLGEKEFQTARLYWRMDEPLAAAIYLKSFINGYTSSPRQFEAQKMIIDAYTDIEQFEQAEFYLELFAKKFPQAVSEHDSRSKDLASARKSFEARVAKERLEKQYKKEDQL